MLCVSFSLHVSTGPWVVVPLAVVGDGAATHRVQASAWLFLETLGQPWVWRRGWGSSHLELGERRMVSAELRAVAVGMERLKKTWAHRIGNTSVPVAAWWE